MQKNVLGSLFCFMCAVLLATTCVADADTDAPIMIPTHNWSSQVVMAHIVGRLFEKNGNTVEYVPTNFQDVYELIRVGDLTVEVEVWGGLFSESFRAALDKGGIIDAGNHNALTREGWWYPMYVKETCPGLPDWQALNACYQQFVIDATAPKGRFLAGPLGWMEHDQERVKALGMRFTVVNAGSAAVLWAALKAAAEQKQPIVLFNWTPNFIDAIYAGEFVNFPAYHPDCHSDASWGINKEAAYDCDNPADQHLKKAAYHKMPELWPTAYRLFTKISFNTEHIATMAAMVDIDKMGHEEAATQWLHHNESVWQEWLE